MIKSSASEEQRKKMYPLKVPKAGKAADISWDMNDFLSYTSFRKTGCIGADMLVDLREDEFEELYLIYANLRGRDGKTEAKLSLEWTLLPWNEERKFRGYV